MHVDRYVRLDAYHKNIYPLEENEDRGLDSLVRLHCGPTEAGEKEGFDDVDEADDEEVEEIEEWLWLFLRESFGSIVVIKLGLLVDLLVVLLDFRLEKYEGGGVKGGSVAL